MRHTWAMRIPRRSYRQKFLQSHRKAYTALRAKGHRHGQALRTLGDRLLRILMAMLRERICYDASRIHREPVVQMG